MGALTFIQLLDSEARKVNSNICAVELSAVAKKTTAYQTAWEQHKKGATERVVRMQLRKAVLEACELAGVKEK